jgi:hypothetical protein
MSNEKYRVGFVNGGMRVDARKYGLNQTLVGIRSGLRAAKETKIRITSLKNDEFIFVYDRSESSSVNVRALAPDMAELYRCIVVSIEETGGDLCWTGHLGMAGTVQQMKAFAGIK